MTREQVQAMLREAGRQRLIFLSVICVIGAAIGISLGIYLATASYEVLNTEGFPPRWLIVGGLFGNGLFIGFIIIAFFWRVGSVIFLALKPGEILLYRSGEIAATVTKTEYLLKRHVQALQKAGIVRCRFVGVLYKMILELTIETMRGQRRCSLSVMIRPVAVPERAARFHQVLGLNQGHVEQSLAYLLDGLYDDGTLAQIGNATIGERDELFRHAVHRQLAALFPSNEPDAFEVDASGTHFSFALNHQSVQSAS